MATWSSLAAAHIVGAIAPIQLTSSAGGCPEPSHSIRCAGNDWGRRTLGPARIPSGSRPRSVMIRAAASDSQPAALPDPKAEFLTPSDYFLDVETSALGQPWRPRLDAAGELHALAIAQIGGHDELIARVLAGRGVAAGGGRAPSRAELPRSDARPLQPARYGRGDRAPQARGPGA